MAPRSSPKEGNGPRKIAVAQFGKTDPNVDYFLRYLENDKNRKPGSPSNRRLVHEYFSLDVVSLLKAAANYENVFGDADAAFNYHCRVYGLLNSSSQEPYCTRLVQYYLDTIKRKPELYDWEKKLRTSHASYIVHSKIEYRNKTNPKPIMMHSVPTMLATKAMRNNPNVASNAAIKLAREIVTEHASSRFDRFGNLAPSKSVDFSTRKGSASSLISELEQKRLKVCEEMAKLSPENFVSTEAPLMAQSIKDYNIFSRRVTI